MSLTRVREITLEDLDALPAPCRGCMFWQSASAKRGALQSDAPGQDAWWRAVQLDWGIPAKGVWRGQELVAFALYAPPLHVQRRRTLPVAPSEDSVVLATMWCHPDERGAGHAKHLLQVLARDAIGHGHKAIEAYATRGFAAEGCVLEGRFLESLGFTLQRAHPELSLYRLDLDRTVSWPQAVGHALGEVIATLQGKERAPARPALETHRPGTS